MKLPVLFVVGLVFAVVVTVCNAQSNDEQVARIETVVQTVTIYVDQGRFDLLDAFYAEEVTADYSSLWGTEPRTLTRSEVGPGWAGFIPGFDTTRHDVSDIEVQTDGETATARANITASHWLNGDLWEISGVYRFELTSDADRWVISSWIFDLESETGDRSLVDIAEARAGRFTE